MKHPKTPIIKTAKPGEYQTKKTVTPQMAKDVKPVKMERTGKHTGKVHLEDGGHVEFKVDDPKKFNLFNNKPHTISKKLSFSVNIGESNVKKNIMSNEDRIKLGLPIDEGLDK